MLFDFGGLDRKSVGEGLTQLREIGGMDSCGRGKDHFALIQPNNIYYHRRSFWTANVEYLQKILGFHGVPECAMK